MAVRIPVFQEQFSTQVGPGAGRRHGVPVGAPAQEHVPAAGRPASLGRASMSEAPENPTVDVKMAMSQMMLEPGFKEAWLSQHHPGHRAAVARVEELHKQARAGKGAPPVRLDTLVSAEPDQAQDDPRFTGTVEPAESPEAYSLPTHPMDAALPPEARRELGEALYAFQVPPAIGDALVHLGSALTHRGLPDPATFERRSEEAMNTLVHKHGDAGAQALVAKAKALVAEVGRANPRAYDLLSRSGLLCNASAAEILARVADLRAKRGI